MSDYRIILLQSINDPNRFTFGLSIPAEKVAVCSTYQRIAPSKWQDAIRAFIGFVCNPNALMTAMTGSPAHRTLLDRTGSLRRWDDQREYMTAKQAVLQHKDLAAIFTLNDATSQMDSNIARSLWLAAFYDEARKMISDPHAALETIFGPHLPGYSASSPFAQVEWEAKYSKIGVGPVVMEDFGEYA